MKVYAFDVDHTLEISGGPVTLKSMMDLRVAGHIVGVCGNMGVFCGVPGWQHLSPFLGQGMVSKEIFLANLNENIKDAEDYVMVGETGWSGDRNAAEKAAWRFILERDFAAGAR